MLIVPAAQALATLVTTPPAWQVSATWLAIAEIGILSASSCGLPFL